MTFHGTWQEGQGSEFVTVTTDAMRVPPPASRPSPLDTREWLGRWHWVVALLAYTFLSLAITYPLIFHLRDVTAGPSPDGDNLWFVWLLWAYRNAVLSGHDPNRTHLIFALLPSVQVFADAHFNMLVGIPLQLITDPLTVYNLLVLTSFVLSGLTMYLLAQEFVTDRFACFAAGFLYTFSTYHFARAAGHFGLMTLQWLPFCAWRLFAFYRRPNRTNAVLAGVGIALVPFSDLYYLAYFLVPFGLLLIVGVLVVNRGWFAQARNLRLSALALIVAAVIAGPVLSSFLSVDPEVQAVIQTESQLGKESLSSDLAAFVLPSSANPLFGTHTQPFYRQFKTPYQPIETSSFLGYPTLLFALLTFLFRRGRTRNTAFWLILTVGGIILTLGPTLFILGHRVIPLPAYNLLFNWPFLSNYRAPNRLTVLPLVALAVLSAYGIALLRAATHHWRAAAVALPGVVIVLLGAAVAENVLWSFPYPTAPIHTSALYTQIAADHEDTSLLDVPLGFSGAYQYDQTIHHKPLVFGFGPRITAQMLGSVYNLPYMAQFIPIGDGAHLQITGNEGDIASHASFSDVLQEHKIKYLVMHRTVEPDSYAKMRAFLVSQLGVPFYDNGAEGLTAWRIASTSVATNDSDAITLGDTWFPGTGQRNGLPERYAEQDARVTIVAPQAHDVTLSFFATPVIKPLTLEVRVNGRMVKTVALSAAQVTQGVSIDHVSLNAGANTVELHAVEGCVRPSDISSSPDTRCFTVTVQEIKAAAP